MINIPYNDILAENHWEKIKDHLVNRIKEVLKQGYTNKRKYKVRTQCRSFLNNLLKEDPVNSANYPNLRELVISHPNRLRDIIIQYKNDYPNLFIGNKKQPWSSFKRIIYNIFIDSCYDNAIFSKKDFIKNIDINTCTYCNRGYIYSVHSHSGDVKPQIDHFYTKSIYPFLGISYYNLIPSCSVCNGFGAKEEHDPLLFTGRDVNANLSYQEQLINPYEIATDDIKFTFNLLTPNLFGNFININIQTPTKGYNKFLKLKQFYNGHTDHVEELIFKSKIKYPKSYRNTIEELFRKEGHAISTSFFYRILINNYVFKEELHKRPLSKLYRDIALQLRIITPEDITP
ncbi:hypothetical protein [Dysgonomonas sp. BGC7]|uniref:hypothetical protein n=1 Tax=Dysgonomonas sp. BGC7 TaxID=1658008 RepID=UPI000682A051|nr:hypothetical protein [Dysgonomonas sp. BGC7]MBD8388349.1 hypothetical protein [Dysgonomonas sp. BGC7]